MTLEYIAKFTRSRRAIVSSHSLNHGLPVPTIMASKGISKLTESWPWSVSLCSFDHGLQVYLKPLSMMSSNFTQS